MACYYTGTAEGDAKLAADEARKELTRVTSMLCEVMQLVEDSVQVMEHELYEGVPGLEAFWSEHKEIDKKRKQKIKDEAIHKLTVEELRVLKELGLH